MKIDLLEMSSNGVNGCRRALDYRRNFPECTDAQVLEHCRALNITQSEMVDWEMRMQNEIWYRWLYAPTLDPDPAPPAESSKNRFKEKQDAQPKPESEKKEISNEKETPQISDVVINGPLSEYMEDIEIFRDATGWFDEPQADVKDSQVEPVAGASQVAQGKQKEPSINDPSQAAQNDLEVVPENHRKAKRRKIGESSSDVDEVCMSDAAPSGTFHSICTSITGTE